MISLKSGVFPNKASEVKTLVLVEFLLLYTSIARDYFNIDVASAYPHEREMDVTTNQKVIKSGPELSRRNRFRALRIPPRALRFRPAGVSE